MNFLLKLTLVVTRSNRAVFIHVVETNARQKHLYVVPGTDYCLEIFWYYGYVHYFLTDKCCVSLYYDCHKNVCIFKQLLKRPFYFESAFV